MVLLSYCFYPSFVPQLEQNFGEPSSFVPQLVQNLWVFMKLEVDDVAGVEADEEVDDEEDDVV